MTAPQIAVTAVCPPTPITPGGSLTYSGTVRNTGNITLTNVVVTRGGIGNPATNIVTTTLWGNDALPAGAPLKYAAKVTRDSRATRSMLWLWTGEVSTDGQGFRVLGTGPEGEMRIPPGIVRRNPAVLNLRLTGMNANGKVYFVDRIYRIAQ